MNYWNYTGGRRCNHVILSVVNPTKHTGSNIERLHKSVINVIYKNELKQNQKPEIFRNFDYYNNYVLVQNLIVEPALWVFYAFRPKNRQFDGSVLVYDFWNPPPLLSILYMTIYFSANLLLCIFFCYLGLGQVEILSGPSAAARMGQGAERCGHISGPSAAASMGQGAERCGHGLG